MSHKNQEELEFIEALIMKRYKELGNNLDSLGNKIASNATFVSVEPSIVVLKELERLLLVLKDIS